MAKRSIPPEVQQQAEELIECFNNDVLGDSDIRFVPRFKGSFLYLDREAYGNSGPICRLRYTGSIDKWEFAIYKYSKNTYDSNEWMFPGSEFVDGTIEGAMKAGMEAYPE